MKNSVLTLLIVTALLLGACASSKPAPVQTSSASGDTPITEQYRKTVQANAEKTGAKVNWVNPPDEDDLARYKKDDKDDDKDDNG